MRKHAADLPARYRVMRWLLGAEMVDQDIRRQKDADKRFTHAEA